MQDGLGIHLWMQVSHRTARQVGEGLGPAVPQKGQAQVGQRVLVEELADKGLERQGHDSGACGAHV